MLLNNVLAGSEYTTLFDEPHLNGPPQGYNSVRSSGCRFGMELSERPTGPRE